MEIIREFIKPASNKLVLDIPERFVQEELEILIIPVNTKPREAGTTVDKQELFNDMCGIWEGRDDITLENIRNKAWKRN